MLKGSEDEPREVQMEEDGFILMIFLVDCTASSLQTDKAHWRWEGKVMRAHRPEPQA
jgi:hypothetical protein